MLFTIHRYLPAITTKELDESQIYVTFSVIYLPTLQQILLKEEKTMHVVLESYCVFHA